MRRGAFLFLALFIFCSFIRGSNTDSAVTIDDLKPGWITKEKILAAKEVRLKYAGDYKMDFYNFAIKPDKETKEYRSYIEICKGNQISSYTKKRLEKLQQGDMIVIGSVVLKNSEGNSVNITGCVYNINLK